MNILAPIWLVLLVPLALVLVVWPPASRVLRALRWTLGLLLVLALVQPVIRWHGRGGTMVVVADRSESMPADALARQKPLLELLNKQRRPGDALAVVAFRQKPEVAMTPGEPAFAGFEQELGRGFSDLSGGLERALDLIPAEGAGRVLILSDGQWTGADPAAAAARAALRGVPVDYQLQRRPPLADLAIEQFQGPETVERGQGFILNAWYRAPVAGPVHYVLKSGGQVAARGTAQAVVGRNQLLFRELAGALGVREYVLEVRGEQPDAVPENNTARLLVSVSGTRPVLCLSPGASSGLAQALRASGLEVVNRKAGAEPLSLSELVRYTGVILENVPARGVGTDGLHNLAAWVQVAGGGLLLTGGEQAYGQGGYLRSPIEALLPLSLEMRREHRKMNLAIAIALDRSGSMAAPAGNGRTKMDMANLGTMEVIRLLADFDHVAVIAVDTQSHVVLPMDSVTKARANIDRVRRIESMGGGICIQEALETAINEVSKAPQKNKHIIVFADACDSRQHPGNYRELVQRCREAGVTVSAVGMGTAGDCDADILKDIGERGKGRTFFSAVPDELPALFAQETFVITGSSFSDQPAAVAFTPAWLDLGGLNLGAPPPLDGYNICYLKKDASCAAVTGDKEHSPVVAFWRAGAGRVLCYAGEADGKFGRQMGQWKRAGDFFATLARWIADQKKNLPDGMLAQRTVRDGLCVVDLYLDPEKNHSFTQRPRVTFLRERSGAEPLKEVTPMTWLAPDQLQCRILLDGHETVLPVVELPGGAHQMLPPACLPFSPEFAPVGPGKGEPALRKIAGATGGREVVELASLWESLPPTEHIVSLRPWLFLVALLLLLVEILRRRTGLPRWPAAWSAPRSAAPQAVTQKVVTPTGAPISRPASRPEEPAPTPKPAAVPAPASPAKSDDTFNAFRAARQQARKLNKR